MTKSKFDRETMTVSDLKKQPIAVVETEISALAKTLGVKPAELFRSMNPGNVGSALDSSRMIDPSEFAEQCCHSDSW